jgi:lytic murein transglycosylase
MPLRLLVRAYACVLAVALSTFAGVAAPSHAFASACSNDGSGFDAWLAGFRQRAAKQGISAATMSQALAGITYDSGVIRLDRGQKSFKLSFEDFYRRRVSSSLITRGQKLMKQHAALFARIEQTFGVPKEVITSIWGLETAYGSDKGGNRPILRSLATLASDCRRSAFFENELLSALRIVQRGDKTIAQLIGGWAGEIGPMQFLPSSYVKFAVDFDGDGRRDLYNSTADMLASTANFLKLSGWQRGQPWGPGTANYEVIREWNKADVYVKTISLMSSRMAEHAE